MLFALSGVSLFAGGNLSPGVREARSNRWVILVFVIIGFLNAYLPAYTDRKQVWTIDGDAVHWLGVILTLLLVPLLLSRIGAEENLLHAHFGPEYSAYCSCTWRLVAGIY